MASLQGVPAALILRNESWVRQQARTMARRLPSNVEKADLIQVGLIAVAQASLSFEWDGDRDSAEAREAFVRYARQRVRGAMLDELRQMDHLGRGQRRQVKIVEVARERWQVQHGRAPSPHELAQAAGMDLQELLKVESAAQAGRGHEPSAGDDEFTQPAEAATARDEVEARVDTLLLMKRLEPFFAGLPARERQVLDAYLGVGLTPVELAASLRLSPSRVSQMFGQIVDNVRALAGEPARGRRRTDRTVGRRRADAEALARQREQDLASIDPHGPWPARLQTVLAGGGPGEEPSAIGPGTRWG